MDRAVSSAGYETAVYSSLDSGIDNMQVGLEMVAPLVLGLVLDHYLGWAPWGVIGGAMLGLFGGVAHLVVIQARSKGPGEQPRRD